MVIVKDSYYIDKCHNNKKYYYYSNLIYPIISSKLIRRMGILQEPRNGDDCLTQVRHLLPDQ